MKKKIKYYLVATILSIVYDSITIYVCHQGITKHPDSLIMNICFCCFIGSLDVLLNIIFFLQAKDLLKPRNECFILKLPEIVENDNFEFPKLDLETGKLKHK